MNKVSYLIATEIDGVPHAVSPNPETNKFDLIPIIKDSQISKAFCSPNKTGAVHILNWINSHDDKLSTANLSVQPEARYFK